ncbi:uncharacterized protein [Euphorbia lathyris]|uniref:uncharacterized protein n=1 Tax=Euphorbia lathyris TaxID=212925 RepID=UPI003313F50C
MGEWEDLPLDLLRMIVDRLSLYDDKVRVACVCKSWRPVFPEISDNKCLLLVPIMDDEDVDLDYDDDADADYRASHALIDVVEKKETLCFLDLQNHMIKDRIYVGSSYGWLISVETSPSISIINPSTKFEIQLPPRFKFPDVLGYGAGEVVDPSDQQLEYSKPSHERHEYHLVGFRGHDFTQTPSFVRDFMTRKVILSSNPSLTTDYIAVAIHGINRGLAFCKPGDDKWSEIVGVSDVADIIFYNGELHALTLEYELIEIDTSPRVTQAFTFQSELIDIDTSRRVSLAERTRKDNKFVGPPHVEVDVCRSQRYLVECCGQLLMVIPYDGEDPHPDIDDMYFINGFVVYEFDMIECQWKLVKDIGDYALFVGLNTSLSFHISQFPEVRRNVIYYTDSFLWVRKYGGFGGYDNGMFNLETGELKELPGYKNNVLAIPPPIWILLPHY